MRRLSFVWMCFTRAAHTYHWLQYLFLNRSIFIRHIYTQVFIANTLIMYLLCICSYIYVYTYKTKITRAIISSDNLGIFCCWCIWSTSLKCVRQWDEPMIPILMIALKFFLCSLNKLENDACVFVYLLIKLIKLCPECSHLITF